MSPRWGGSSGGLPSHVEYLSPQGLLLPLSTVQPPHSCGLSCGVPLLGRRPPSWTVYRLACHRLLPWLRVTFAMVPHVAWPGSDQRPWSTSPAAGPAGRLGRPSVSHPWGVVTCTLATLDAHLRAVPMAFLALVYRCARTVRCVCGIHDSLALVHRSCSSVAWCARLVRCVCDVHGSWALVHRCVRLAYGVSVAPWRLFTGVRALCVVCAVSVAPWRSFVGVRALCVVCVVSVAPWRLFTSVRALCVRWCGVRGFLALVHRCARLVHCVCGVCGMALVH